LDPGAAAMRQGQASIQLSLMPEMASISSIAT
jgi:hypothetical protein